MSVFTFPGETIITLDEKSLVKLKSAAAEAELKRARYCLHHSPEDNVQEMVIAFCRDSNVPVHRHHRKSESFHIIEGELEVLFYDEKGNQIKKIRMGPIHSGLPFLYRLASDEWHTVKPLSDFVIIHETTAGPFDPEEKDILELDQY